MALTFYTNPMSRGRIVRWMLEEVGQPYETVLLDYVTTMKAPEYLAINPMGKVPALVHDGRLATETGAICAYLADAFPGAGLVPEDRAAWYRWMFFGAGPLEAAVSNRALGMVPPEGREATLGYGSFERVLDTLEAALSEAPYLAGAEFSAADVYTGSQIAWGMMFGTIEPRPVFDAYVGRITSRPAAKRAREMDDALMPRKA